MCGAAETTDLRVRCHLSCAGYHRVLFWAVIRQTGSKRLRRAVRNIVQECRDKQSGVVKRSDDPPQNAENRWVFSAIGPAIRDVSQLS